MDLSSSQSGPATIVTVNAPRIDAAVAIRFKDALRDIAGRGGDPVILDLHKVSFVDSSGLGAIVAVMKQMAPDRRLDLAGLQPAVDKVFHLTRLDTVFRIHPGPVQNAAQIVD